MIQSENLNYISCNLCGSSQSHILFFSTVEPTAPNVSDYIGTNPGYGKFHNIVKCMNCSLVYMNPRDKNIPTFLKAVEDFDYIKTWNERLLTFNLHLAEIANLKNETGKLLDIGCYAGIFLSAAKAKGYDVEGLEPSTWAAQYASEKVGVPVIHERIEAMQLKNRYYDIVTIWDAIEHFEDPSEALKKVEASLNSKGLVFITTHDIESLFAKALGRFYPWLMRFHLYHFSQNTLEAMLLKNGLKPILFKKYKKVLPLSYFLGKLGLNLKFKILDRIKLSINTGDMFLIAAEKIN